jgi:hypothetical protein
MVPKPTPIRYILVTFKQNLDTTIIGDCLNPFTHR